MRSKAIVILIVMVALLTTWAYIYLPVQSVALATNDALTNIVIVGPKQDLTAKKLYTTAISLSLKDANIIWWDRKEGPLKNARIQYPKLDKAAAYVCHGQACSLPLFQSQELIEYVNHVKSKQSVSHANQQTLTEILLSSGSWTLTILGFIAIGLLLSFSPCILPLIPIMASIIVGQTIGVRKSRTFLLCFAYVLSMSLTYSLLGMMAGMFGFYIQIYMQQTWIVVSFSLIFFMLALSMLGAYEIRLPHKFMNKLHYHSTQQQGGSFIGVMSMGVLATLIVSPCVTAPLAAILSYITQTSDYILGAVSLFFMGIGMGLPLLIISVFSKNILPKVAHWDKKIKNIFGLILMGMSIWIASRVISTELSYVLWAGLFILISIFMGIFKRKTKRLTAKFWKTLTIMVFLLGVSIFFNVIISSSTIYKEIMKNSTLPTAHSARQITTSFQAIHNLTELEKYIKISKMNRTLVFLDFTAEWCVACKKMENEVFSNPGIQSQLSKFMLLRVDLTDANADSMKIAKKFQIIGPPAVIFFDVNGKLMNTRAMGEYDVQQFSKILQTVSSSTLSHVR